MENDGKTYKYHTRLLALYGILSSKCMKTRDVLEDIDVDFGALHDAYCRDYIDRLSFLDSNVIIESPNRSDKMSHWWKMKPKGFIVLKEKFDVKLTAQQQAIAARYLLNGE